MQRYWRGILLGCMWGLMIFLLVSKSGAEAGPSAADASPAAGNATCEQVFTGTMRSVYRVCSTNGLTVAEQSAVPYPNYQVEVNPPNGAPCIVITVTSRSAISSSASFPVNPDTLPESVRIYLAPDEGIDVGNPSIVALAGQLTHGIHTQEAAVASIIVWVQSHIAYDSSVSDNSASEVLAHRRAADSGFAFLTVALLRAAGIPSDKMSVGLLSYQVMNNSWPVRENDQLYYIVRVYYPDTGWMLSDPQRTINWIDTAHLVSPFGLLGFEGTYSMTLTSHLESLDLMEQIGHTYTDTIVNSGPLYSALNTSGDSVLEWSPSRILLAVDASSPAASVTLMVASRRCESAWALTSSELWLIPSVTSGSVRADVRLDIDASGLSAGLHPAYLTLRTADTSELPVVTSTIPVMLLVGNPLYSLNLPLVHKR